MKKAIVAGLLTAGLVFSCGQPETGNDTTAMNTEDTIKSRLPDWTKDANLYEVNIRQYTPEGTITAFKKHLPRLADMGVKILWFMPVQPIGKLNRKGPLGSYYSIQDYTAVNPEFGTMEEFSAVVKEARELGMYVILDWVANHTSFDHVWAMENPDWYVQDSLGTIIAPNPDWTDVAELNYDNADMRNAMINAMKFWVNEVGIDGFRCDVAFEVPTDFWETAAAELKNEKLDIFLLAEADHPDHNLLDSAFHADYAWDLHHIMNDVAAGKKTVAAFETYRMRLDSLYDNDIVKMAFTSNHDENSWNGTEFERMGGAHKAYFVLATTWTRTIPLVYSGQEAGLNKRLRFFDKDTITWDELPYQEFYKQMLELKSSHKALANGNHSGDFEVLLVDEVANVYAYQRKRNDQAVVVVLNFGKEPFAIKENRLPLTESAELYYGSLDANRLLGGQALVYLQ